MCVIIVIMCEIIVTMCVLIAIMCVIIGAIIVIMCDDCDRPVPSPQPRSLLSSAPSSAPLLPQPRSMVLRFLRVEEFVRGGDRLLLRGGGGVQAVGSIHQVFGP